MKKNFSQMLAHVTGGRRYCFVIMSYHEGYSFFERVKQIVGEETGFECLRADDIPGVGQDLREKIHATIEGAVFVLADVSQPRPNIYYEIGYAIARNKTVVILAKEGVEIETDLQGLELIRYIDNREGWPRFEQNLRHYLSFHRDTHISLLRAMIIPPDPQPSFLVLNPKKPQESSRFKTHPRERRTYGDYLGLMGVMSIFASVYGEHCIPELVSASHAADELMEWDANFFLIGSPKVNKFTGLFLEEMQKKGRLLWELRPFEGDESIQDYTVQLVGRIEIEGKPFASPRDQYNDHGQRVDYGLIVRGPHPRFPHRLVTILCGPHSLGTGGACLAATKSQLVQQISQKLTGKIDLTTHGRGFWVLVRAVASTDHHLDASNVSIIDAGLLD